MRPKSLVAGLAATAALALPLVFAGPASAATLPTGDQLWAISCDSGEETGFSAILYSLNAADAAATPVGIGTGFEGDCAGQSAYNPVTGASYYLSWAESPGKLAKIDLATGLATVIPFTGDDYLDPNSITIGTDGVGYMLEQSWLSTFNVETGATTYLGDIGLTGFFGFAVDPTSGLLYAVDFTGASYLIDPVAKTATFQGNILGDAGGNNYYSLQIDTAGRWWVQENAPSGSLLLSGAKPNPDAATQFETAGLILDGDNDPYTQSLLITYPKALAATGLDATVLIGAGATAGLLLLMGGAVLVLRRRAS